MKALFAAALALAATGAKAQTLAQQFPSCDLKAQHALKGQMNGSVEDPRQAHIALRANILEADLSNAKKAGRLTQATAARLYQRAESVTAAADRDTRKQGFLSTSKTASADRALDAIAAQVCRPQPAG